MPRILADRTSRPSRLLFTFTSRLFQELTNAKRILKICTLIPVYSIGSWISIAWPNSYIYIYPWLEFYQGIALGSFFLLLCEYVSPSAASRDVFFAALKVPNKRRGRDSGKEIDGLAWYRKKWFAVFQYPIVALLVSIVTDITQGANVYCLTSSSAHFAHLWVCFAILPTYPGFGTDLYPSTVGNRSQHLNHHGCHGRCNILRPAEEGPETPQTTCQIPCVQTHHRSHFP